jgi:hypothetical protein
MNSVCGSEKACACSVFRTAFGFQTCWGLRSDMFGFSVLGSVVLRSRFGLDAVFCSVFEVVLFRVQCLRVALLSRRQRLADRA